MAAGDLALRIIITATGGQAIAELEAVKGAARDAGTGISAGMLIGAAAVAFIGIASIRAAGDFQQQMLHIQALAGATADQVKLMGSQILAMAPQVAQMPTDLAKAMFQIVSSLVPANQQMQALYYSGIMASTGMANVVDVARVLSTIMKIYGINASTAANDMTVAVTMGRMTMTDYANSIGLVVLNGKNAGFSFNELNAALDVLTTHGFPSAQQAARNLGQLFTQMDLGMDAMAKRAKSMGLAFDENKFKTLGLAQQIQYLNEVTGGNAAKLHTLIGGGRYAYQTFEALVNGAGDYAKILGLLGKAQDGVGAAQLAWTVTQQGFNDQLQKGQAALQVLLITIGNALLPVVGNIIGAFAGWTGQLVGWLNSGNAVNDALTLTGKYAQIVLPILTGLGTLVLALIVPAFWDWAEALLANPITWVVLAVAGLTAAFIHFYQTNAGFKAVMDDIGNAFKQVGGWIMSTILPALQQFGGWLQTNVVPPLELVWNAINQQLVPTIQSLGNWITTSLVPAFQRAWSFIQTNVVPIFIKVWEVMQMIGTWLLQTFTPVWNQLVQVWQTMLFPALQQIVQALQPVGVMLLQIGGFVKTVFLQFLSYLQPVLPALKMLAMILGVLVITAIGLVIGLIAGLIKGFAGLLSGVATVIGGVVQIFTGLIQVVTGVVTFIYDLLTGQWSKLGSDLDKIWQGMLNIVKGVWNAIVGVFQGVWGAISGVLSGFWNGIVGFFMDLWNKLTGHSIIPDMIASVVKCFAGLVGSALGAVAALPGKLVTWAAGMAKDAVTWGGNIIKNLASGIIGGIGSAIGGAMSNLGSFIHDHLPHSPAKLGPLRELEAQGAQIPGQIATGILKGVPKLQSALRTSLTLPALTQQNAFALQAPANQNQQVNMTINLDGKQITQAVGVRLAHEVRIQGNVRGH